MIRAELVPVDHELAELARCWMCKQGFENDASYCQVTLKGTQSPVWVTCVGCACQLACTPST